MATTDFRVDIWRANGSNFDLVGESENFASSLTAGQINTVTLSSPITGVQEGDYYGFRLNGSATAVYARTPVTGVNTYYVSGATPSSTNYNWRAQTLGSQWVIPIELYMTAPQAVFIGDSIMAGHNANYSFLESTATTNITSTIEYQLGQLTSYTYQNMGIGGQTSASIATRFTSDVVNLHPRLAVIEAGVNDLPAGTESTFLASWTTMLAAAQASSDIQNIIVLKILPCTSCTNVQMQARDTWNNDLTTLAAGYSKAIVVDASSYVGQFRSGGDAGNLWDIKTEYNSDNVHFTPTGHGQIAQAIANAINNLPGISPIIQTNSLSNPSDISSQNPTLSAEYDNINSSDPAGYYEVQVIKSDGSWSAPLWDSGKVATNIAEGSTQTVTYGGTALLLNGVTYYQRWKFWDSVSGNASQYSAGTDFWVMQHVTQNLNSWSYVKKITINSSSVSGTDLNFPVLINLSSDANLAAHAELTGYDILFTSSTINWNTGTENDKLPHEIESYNSSTGALVAWVNVPAISSSTNTDIYMYYGNSSVGVTESNASSTWDANFMMVQHLNQSGLNGTSGEVLDSTANANNGTSYGGVAGGDNGAIGKAINFNGSSQYINDGIKSGLKPTGAMTLSAWFQGQGEPGASGGLGTLGNSGSRGYAITMDNAGSVTAWIPSSATALFYKTATGHDYTAWVKYDMVFSPSQYLYLYRNGVLVATSTTSVPAAQYTDNGISFKIGNRGDLVGATYFAGLIDEVELSNSVRSSDWITTSFNNQNNPGTFYTAGLETQIYTVTFNKNNGDTEASPATEQTNNNGNVGTLPTAPARTGYTFSGWNTQTNGLGTTFAATTVVANNTTVYAQWTINTFTVTSTAGNNGTISPLGATTTNYGSNLIYTITPNSNYHVADVLADSVSVGATSSYTFTNITATHTIVASFAIDTSTLTYTASSHGSLTGTSTQTINYGSDGTAVTAVPDTGYHFVNWSDASTQNPRTDTNVVTNTSVTASFELTPHSGGGAPPPPPPGIGAGVHDVRASGVGSTVTVGEVTSAGVNVLTYITSQNNFTIAESSNNWQVGNHSFQITNLDLGSYIVTLTFSSKPQTITLKKGESKELDLDGDKINDILVTFTNTYSNRAEITIKSLSKTITTITNTIVTNVQSPITKYFFKRNLSTGMIGVDVKELQKYLNANGYAVAKSGAGSTGNETIKFGALTRQALIKFQKVNKINPAVGYFGPVTRGVVNK